MDDENELHELAAMTTEQTFGAHREDVSSPKPDAWRIRYGAGMPWIYTEDPKMFDEARVRPGWECQTLRVTSAVRA